VLDGLRGENPIAELCRRESIAESMLRREAQDLKEVVAKQALELRLLKKSMIADGGDQT
jgi:transposase